MGLKADVDEVVAAWQGYPWRLKAWLVLSLFLASSSIASLSETVFKWKAFFLDAVRFYREWITSPIASWLSHIFAFPLPPSYGDLVLLIMLFATANARVALFASPSLPFHRRWMSAGFATGVLLYLLLVTLTERENVQYGVVVFATVMGIVGFSVYYYRLGGATRLLWFIYMLTPPALVGIAGAINAGLTR